METAESTTLNRAVVPQQCRRRYLQFGLRTLLAFTFLAALGLALLQWRAERHRRALAELKAHGVTVVIAQDPPFPLWVRTLVGDDWLGAEYAVEVAGGITETQFRELRQLPRVVSVAVAYPHFTPFDIVNKDMDRLERELSGVKMLTVKGDR